MPSLVTLSARAPERGRASAMITPASAAFRRTNSTRARIRPARGPAASADTRENVTAFGRRPRRQIHHTGRIASATSTHGAPKLSAELVRAAIMRRVLACRRRNRGARPARCGRHRCRGRRLSRGHALFDLLDEPAASAPIVRPSSAESDCRANFTRSLSASSARRRACGIRRSSAIAAISSADVKAIDSGARRRTRYVRVMSIARATYRPGSPASSRPMRSSVPNSRVASANGSALGVSPRGRRRHQRTSSQSRRIVPSATIAICHRGHHVRGIANRARAARGIRCAASAGVVGLTRTVRSPNGMLPSAPPP